MFPREIGGYSKLQSTVTSLDGSILIARSVRDPFSLLNWKMFGWMKLRPLVAVDDFRELDGFWISGSW